MSSVAAVAELLVTVVAVVVVAVAVAVIVVELAAHRNFVASAVMAYWHAVNL